MHGFWLFLAREKFSENIPRSNLLRYMLDDNWSVLLLADEFSWSLNGCNTRKYYEYEHDLVLVSVFM